MLTYGQILTIAPTKWVYLVAVVIFEVGSLVCGVAPSMNVLIFGRAFAGVGAAGIFVSILSIIAQITRLEDRPALFGTFGMSCATSPFSSLPLTASISQVPSLPLHPSLVLSSVAPSLTTFRGAGTSTSTFLSEPSPSSLSSSSSRPSLSLTRRPSPARHGGKTGCSWTGWAALFAWLWSLLSSFPSSGEATPSLGETRMSLLFSSWYVPYPPFCEFQAHKCV
jgi:MFS family permease